MTMESYAQLTKNLTRHFLLTWKIHCNQVSRNSPVLCEVDFFRQRLRLVPGTSLPVSPQPKNQSSPSSSSHTTRHCFPLDHVVTIHRHDAQNLRILILGQGKATLAQSYSLGFSNPEQCDEFHRLVRGNIFVDGPRVVKKFLESRPDQDGYIRLEQLADPHWKALLLAGGLDPRERLSFFTLFGYLIACKEQLERTAPPQMMFGVRLWPKETVLLCCPLTWRVHPRFRTLSRGALFITTARLLFCTYPQLTQILCEADYERFLAEAEAQEKTEQDKEGAVDGGAWALHRQTLQTEQGWDEGRISVSFLAIEDVQVLRAQQLRVDLGDQRCLVFGFDRLALPGVANSITRMVLQYRQDVRRLFAFQSFDHQLEASGLGTPGWQLYDPAAELHRLGLASGDWRLLRVAPPLCTSYPELVAVPATFSDAKLRRSALCRRNSRFPVTVFRFPETQATLSRSAAPVRPPPPPAAAAAASFSSAPQPETDEELLGILRVLNPNWPTRPLFIGAMGTSNERELGVLSPPTTFRYFLQRSSDPRDLQQSWLQFGQLIAHTSETQSCTRDPVLVTETGGSSSEAFFRANVLEPPANLRTRALAEQLKRDSNWYERLGQSRWLQSVRLLLYHARLVVEIMTARRSSVLLHDTEGWDRSAQVSALAQLLLDPHFRTVRGFLELVEKEWLTMGHPFALRSGWSHTHTAPPIGKPTPGGAGDPPGEFGGSPPGGGGGGGGPSLESALQNRAPVFLLWMDSVWQLTQQFPTEFQFTGALLSFILEQLQTGRYGTFLLNNQLQRSAVQAQERTASLWTTILTAVQLDPRHPFLNPIFGLKVDSNSSSSRSSVSDTGDPQTSSSDSEAAVEEAERREAEEQEKTETNGDPSEAEEEEEEEEEETGLSPEQVDKLTVNWWTNRLRLFYDRYDSDRVADSPQEIQGIVEQYRGQQEHRRRRSLSPAAPQQKRKNKGKPRQEEEERLASHILNQHMPGVFQGLLRQYGVNQEQVDALWEIGGALEPPELLAASHRGGAAAYEALAHSQVFPESLVRRHVQDGTPPSTSQDREGRGGRGRGRGNLPGGEETGEEEEEDGLVHASEWSRVQDFPGVLRPDVRQHSILFWREFYLRWDSRPEEEEEVGGVKGLGEGSRLPLLAGIIQSSGERVRGSEAELQTLQGALQTAREHLEHLESERDRLRTERTELESRLERETQRRTTAEASREDSEARQANALRQVAELSEELKILTDERTAEQTRLLRELERLQEDQASRLADLTQRLTAAQASEAEHRRCLGETQRTLAEVQSSEAGQQETITELRAELERLKTAAAALPSSSSSSSSDQQLQALETELTAARATVEALEKTRDGLQTELEAQKALLAESQAAEEDLRTAQAALERLEESCGDLTAEREQLLAAVQTRKAAEEHLRTQVAELEAREAQARDAEADAITELETRSGELSRLLEASQARLHSLEAELEAERTTVREQVALNSGLQERIGSLEASLAAKQEEQETALGLLRSQVEEGQEDLRRTRSLLEESEAEAAAVLQDLRSQVQEKERRAATAEARRETLTQELGAVREEVQSLKEAAVEREVLLARIQELESGDTQSEQERFQELTQLRTALGQREEQKRSLETKLETLDQESRGRIRALEEEAAGHTQELSFLRGQATETKHQLRLLEDLNQKLELDTERKSEQLTLLRTQAQEQELRIAGLESELGSLREKLRSAEESQAAESRERMDLTRKLRDQETTIVRLEEQNQAHSERTARTEAFLAGEQRKITELEGERERARERWTEERTSLQALRTQLETELEQLRALHTKQGLELESSRSEAQDLRLRTGELETAKLRLQHELEEFRKQASEDEQKRREAEETRLQEAEKLPSGQPKFTVSIPSWGHRQDGDKSIVYFEIRIREYYTRRKYLYWILKKRYSEFEKLHKLCRQTFRHLVLPPLPPKSRMGKVKRSREFLNQRQKSLETMLQALLKEPELLGAKDSPGSSGDPSSSPLVKFLEIGAPGREILEGEDS